MKKVAIAMLVAIAALYLAAIFVPVAPNEQRPGTRLTGTLVEEPDVDWSFIEGQKKVWVQTRTWYLIPHSVTTTSWVFEGDYYVPCGWCASKRWPRNVAANPEVVVKVDDKLYPRRAVLISAPEERHKVLASLMGHEVADGVEVYRMDPP